MSSDTIAQAQDWLDEYRVDIRSPHIYMSDRERLGALHVSALLAEVAALTAQRDALVDLALNPPEPPCFYGSIHEIEPFQIGAEHQREVIRARLAALGLPGEGA